MKKYELVLDAGEGSSKRYRIRALKAMKLSQAAGEVYVKAGEWGGLVSGPDNLSQQGTCWIDSTSAVVGNARVCDSAFIKDSSMVEGHAVVEHEAFVGQNSLISGSARIRNSAALSGVKVVDATIAGNSEIGFNANQSMANKVMVVGSATKILGRIQTVFGMVSPKPIDVVIGPDVTLEGHIILAGKVRLSGINLSAHPKRGLTIADAELSCDADYQDYLVRGFGYV